MQWDNIKIWGDIARTHADERGDKIAFVGPNGKSTSFGEFNQRVNRLTHALHSRSVMKGERVAILAKNCTEYVEAYGVAKSGLILVPLNWRLTASELLSLLAHSRPKVLIVDATHREIIASIRSELNFIEHFVLIGETAPGWLAYETLLSDAEHTEPEATVTPNDVLCIIYTSGTTGAPKGVALTHRGVIGNAQAAAVEMLQLTPHDRGLAVPPFFHVGGFWYYLFPNFAAGATTWILAGFEPVAVLHALVTHRITHVHLVPTMIATLLSLPECAAADLSALRILYYAASSIPLTVLTQAMATFTSCSFVQSYGATESGCLTLLSGQDHLDATTQHRAQLLTSCGRPVANGKLKIIDDTGNEMPSGEIGEIAVSSHRQMHGYWQDEAATAKVRENGWLRMGDLGYVDADGYVFIVDRKNDMIVTGGENVYPSEVEAALYRDPAIAQACVVGMPDIKWVQKVVAVVVLKADAVTTTEEINSHLRTTLAAYKCPKLILIRDHLPMNATGKILRRTLRESLADL